MNQLLQYLQNNDNDFRDGGAVGLGYMCAGSGNDIVGFMLDEYYGGDDKVLRYWAIRALGYGAHGVYDKPASRASFSQLVTLGGRFPNAKAEIRDVLNWLADDMNNQDAKRHLGR